MNRQQRSVPAARPGLVAEQIGREWVVFDTMTNQAHCLAPVAAAVFTLCDGRTPIDDLPALAGSSVGEPVSPEDVAAALRQLEDAGILDSPLFAAPRTISRRTMLRRSGAAAGVAFATPVITSIMTPAFAQASPARRCPGSRCVSQSEGDVFCGCNNVCPPGSPGAGGDSTCTDQGLTPPFFDSCFCAECPNERNPRPGQVPAGFEHLCLPPEQQNTPCGGGGTPNMGCKDPTKPLDGICVPNDGDSSELCINPGGPAIV